MTAAPIPVTVQVGAWPGGKRPDSRRLPKPGEPLGARVGLVMAAVAERDVIPERLGMLMALEVWGPSILRGFLVLPGDCDSARCSELETWAARQRLDTSGGPKALEVCTVSAFFAPGHAAPEKQEAGPFTEDAYTGGGTIVAADMLRLLGLVAEYSSPARRRWRGGWKLWLPGWSKEKLEKNGKPGRGGVSPHRPPLHMRAAGPHGLFARFDPCEKGNGKERNGKPWEGRFLDVIPAGHALDGLDSSDLADHLEAFGLERRDAPAALPMTADGAAELLETVRAVHSLALEEDKEAERWSGRARCNRVDVAHLHSPSTIARLVLERAGLRPPLEKFSAPDDEALDRWQSSSFGGWQTAELAGAGAFPAADIDIRSAYPAAWCLLGGWDLLRAERLEEQDALPDLLELCTAVAAGDLSPLFDRDTWRRMGFTLCEVSTNGDELPLDVVDEDHRDGGWRMRRVTGRTLAYAWPYVVLSARSTGHSPDIVSATRLWPVGTQAGVRKTVELLDRKRVSTECDPVAWFVRRRAQAKKDAEDESLPEECRRKAKREAGQLRVMVNALTYGNPLRLDTVPTSKRGRPVSAGEKPAQWTFPPLGVSVAASATLLVGMAERLVCEAGGTVAARDTDGLLLVASPLGGVVPLEEGRSANAIAWHTLEEVLSRFDTLDPFKDDGAFWSVDRDSRRSPLWAIVLRRKRYALFTRGPDGGRAEIVKATEHALAVPEPPPGCTDRRPDGRWVWTEEVAAHAIDKALGEASPAPEWNSSGTPALVRQQIGTPAKLAEAPEILGLHPGSRVVRAWGDPMWSSSKPSPWLLDPGDDLAGALESPGWRDGNGQPVTVQLGAVGGGFIADTLESRAARWLTPIADEDTSGAVCPTVIRHVGRAGVVIDQQLSGGAEFSEKLGRHLYSEESTCPGCRAPVSRPGADYCSERCRQKKKKARQRERKRGASGSEQTGDEVSEVLRLLAERFELFAAPLMRSRGAAVAITTACETRTPAEVVEEVARMGPLTGAENAYRVLTARLRKVARAPTPPATGPHAGEPAEAVPLQRERQRSRAPSGPAPRPDPAAQARGAADARTAAGAARAVRARRQPPDSTPRVVGTIGQPVCPRCEGTGWEETGTGAVRCGCAQRQEVAL